MLTWKDNIKDVVKGIDQTKSKVAAAKQKTLQELTSIAFKTQVDLYVKDASQKGNQYMPVSDGDISRYTRRKTLSVKSYFSSKQIISRSGDLRDNLLNASDASKDELKYSNDDVGFEIDKDSIKVIAVSDRFGAIERAKSGKGSKSSRNTTKKTWLRIVKLFAKTFNKHFNPK